MTVYFKRSDGTVRVHSSLEDAISVFSYYYIAGLQLTKGFALNKGYIYNPGWYSPDYMIFLDELGFQIPLWKVLEVNEKRRPKPKVRFKFRDGPVWGVHHSKWHRGSWNRKIKTHGYNKWVESAKEDEDDLGFSLPDLHKKITAWDEQSMKWYTKNWKKYRKTQYHGCQV